MCRKLGFYERWDFRILWVFSILSIVWVKTNAFNVDTVNYVSYSGPSDSMFGFTVALHKEDGQPWALVGAPEAQTQQPGVIRGGAVFQCDVRQDDACHELAFDRTGNNNSSRGDQMDEKSRQWFGATLSSVGENGSVVACAPRYVFRSNARRARDEKRDPVGTCFVAKKNLREFLEYSPCRTANSGYHRQGYCQAGFGAAMSKDSERVFIGAPGSWYWHGQLYSVRSNLHLAYTIPKGTLEYGDIDYRGQVFAESSGSDKRVSATGPGPETEDDSYLGYSVAAGDFTGRGEQGVAVGMPKGAGLQGKVLLYTSDLKNLQNITGNQLGAYFGYAMCVSDVDGDGLDDLIVGAPMYTDLKNNKGDFETGQIYIFYQKREKKFETWETRADATVSRSRFGLALANLGDINLDKYGDFAVGSPYDGPHGHGAVYIYHGSSTGVRKKFSQVIFAEELDPFMSTFGFSVSGGGVDMDSNKYPDMMAGAYKSNKAFLFRSRPVVDLAASVVFDLDSKVISLDERKCTLKNSIRVPCAQLHACLEYYGVGVDDRLEFDVSYVLDSKKLRTPRMYFLNDEGKNILNQTLFLTKGIRNCKTMSVYIKDSIRDKLTPLEAEMRYSLRGLEGYGGTASSLQPHRRERRSTLPPVLNSDRGLVQRDSLNIQKNCGPDNVCIPDLRMTVTPNVNKYLLGSKKRLEMDVLVQNEGEDAFESTFYMLLPPGVDFNKVERIDKSEGEIPIICSPPKPANNNTLRCDIGNPLPKRKYVNFRVLLDPYHKSGMKPSYDFYMETNTTNPEKNETLHDNKLERSVGIWVETDLSITGSSLPPDLHYNNSLYTTEKITHEADLGPQVAHIYNIRNNGPSTIEEAELYLVWPTKTWAGEDLFYMLEQPELSGNIYCSPIMDVNPLGLVLDKKKSTLESSGVQIQISENPQVRVELPDALGIGSRFGTAAAATSGSTVGMGHGGSGLGSLTEEERRRLEELEAQGGDASLIHLHRNKEAQEQEEAARRQGHGTSSSGQWISGARPAGSGTGGSTSTHKEHFSGAWSTDRASRFEKDGAVVTNQDYDRQIEIQNLGRYLESGAKISEEEYYKRLNEYTTANQANADVGRLLDVWEKDVGRYLDEGRKISDHEFRRRLSEYADRLVPLPKLNPEVESQIQDIKHYFSEGRHISQDEYKKRLNEYTSRYLPEGTTGSLDSWHKDIGRYLEDGRRIGDTEYRRRIIEYIIRLLSPQKSYAVTQKPYSEQNIATYLINGQKVSEREYHKRLNEYANQLRSSGELSKHYGSSNLGTYLDEGRRISDTEYYRRLQEYANFLQSETGSTLRPTYNIQNTTTYIFNGQRVSEEEYYRKWNEYADQLRLGGQWNERFEAVGKNVGDYLNEGRSISEKEYYRRLQHYANSQSEVVVTQRPSYTWKNVTTYIFNGQRVSEQEFHRKMNEFAEQLRSSSQWNQRFDSHASLGAYLDEGRRISENEYYRRLQEYASRQGTSYTQQNTTTYIFNGQQVSEEEYHRKLNQYVEQLRTSGQLSQAFDSSHQNLGHYLEEGRRISENEYYRRLQDFINRQQGSTIVRFSEIDMNDIGKYLEDGRRLGVGEYHKRLAAYARMLQMSGDINRQYDASHPNLGRYLEEGRRISEAEYYRRLQDYANQQQTRVDTEVHHIGEMNLDDIRRYIEEGRRSGDHEYHRRLSAYAHLLQTRGELRQSIDASNLDVGRYLDEGRRISDDEYYRRLEHFLRQQQSHVESSSVSHISSADMNDIVRYLDEGRRLGNDEYHRRLNDYAHELHSNGHLNKNYFEEGRLVSQDEYYRRIQEYANQHHTTVESSSVSHVSVIDINDITRYLEEGRRQSQREYHRRLAEYARKLHLAGTLSQGFDAQHPNLGRYLDDGRRISENEYYRRLQSYADLQNSRVPIVVDRISQVHDKDIVSYLEEGRRLGQHEYRRRMLEYANKIQESGELQGNVDIKRYLEDGRSSSEDEYFRRLHEYARRVQSRVESSTVESRDHGDRNYGQFLEEGGRLGAHEYRRRLLEYAHHLHSSGELRRNEAMYRYLEEGRSISEDEYYRRLQEYASRQYSRGTTHTVHRTDEEEYRRRTHEESRRHHGSGEVSAHGDRDWSTEITINPELLNSGGAASRYGSAYNRSLHRGNEHVESGVRYGTSEQQTSDEEETRENVDTSRRGGLDFSPNSGLGAAALGRGGFHTTTLDLGVQSSRHGHVDTSGRRVYEDNDRNLETDDGEYVYNDYDSKETAGEGVHATYEHPYSAGGGSHHESSEHHHSSSSSSHAHRESHRDRDGHQIRYYDRFRRQAEEQQVNFNLKEAITCNATQCALMRCLVGPLPTDGDTWIAFRSRVNAQTLRKIGSNRNVVLSSLLVARVTKLPYIGTPKETPLKSHEVFTTVAPSDPYIKPDIVPLWVVVLSAVAGAIILLLLIYLLYKCGFFKRNRPSNSPERQPLNRNGNYHGDEQL